MKYLIIPGLPLLVVALTLHDADGLPATIASAVAVGLLTGGAAFVLFYACYQYLTAP